MNDTLIEFLRAQSEDYTITWYCDGMTETEPWETGWVDVMVAGRLAWTISDELDINDDIKWPPDLVCMFLIDPVAHPPVVRALSLPVDQVPSVEATQQMISFADDASDEAYWSGAPAWSATEVGRAVEDWCLQHVGRPVRAVWDPTPDVQSRDQAGPSEAFLPRYMIRAGDNEGGRGATVYASAQVMDMLLAEMVEDDL